MIKEFIFQSLFWLADFIKKGIHPTRWIYSSKQFANDINIDTRSANPISFICNTEMPIAHIWLKITNKSQYLDAFFDRAVIESLDVHDDAGLHNILRYENIITRTKVNKKDEAEVFTEIMLNSKQVEVLQKLESKRGVTCGLHMKYYVDSDVYSFSKDVHLESRPCELCR